MNKILLFGLIILLNVSCSSSSNGIDASPITGDYVYTTSKTMGGYEISGKWRLNITRNGDGDYSYTIIKTITDQMYGGNPKSETSTGKFAKTVDNNNDWYLNGYGNAYISIPFGGFKEAPDEITMYGDGDTKHFIRSYSSNSDNTDSQTSNSANTPNPSNDEQYKDISGDYYGESIMGNSVGIGQISITPSGRIGVSYNHGDLGSAKEYGDLTPFATSQTSSNLHFKFQKDAGGNYDIRVVKSSSQMVVILTGDNWKVTTTRSIHSNSLPNTSVQTVIPDTLSYDSTTEPNEKKLVYLFTANGGMVGYYNDGTVVGCPRCDFCKSNILAMLKEKPMGKWDLKKPDDFVSYEEDNGWVLINYIWKEKVPQY